MKLPDAWNLNDRGFGDLRTWALSISIKYVHRSHKSLHPSKTIPLARSHPPLPKERWGWSYYLSSLLRFNATRHKSKTIALINQITYRHRHKLHRGLSPIAAIANLPPFFPNLLLTSSSPSRSVRTFVPFFPTSLCLPRGKYEWHNASRPRLCHPLSPPSPLGLDSAIELQKRMPAAATGEQRWVQHARVPRSITIQRVYETPRWAKLSQNFPHGKWSNLRLLK